MTKTALSSFDTPTPVGYSRKKWFTAVKAIVKLFVRKPEFVFLGEAPGPGSIILSNHEGASGPLTLELYARLPIRFWGTYEMNTDFKTAYRYQTNIYYHQKKRWNIHLARLFCLIATPLTRMFYIGLELISSYGDVRLRSTFRQSIDILKKHQTLVIFPEVSDRGYFKVLTGFYPGVSMMLEQCRRNGLNVPVYVAYLNKETRKFIFDAPKSVDELLEEGLSRADLAEKLCNRCNELGKMQLPDKR